MPSSSFQLNFSLLLFFITIIALTTKSLLYVRSCSLHEEHDHEHDHVEDEAIFVHQIHNFADIDKALVEPRKPSFLLIHDAELHSSIGEILWPRFASLHRDVASVASIDYRKYPQAKKLFGVDSLDTNEISIRYFKPGSKRFKIGGIGSRGYFSFEKLQQMVESVSIAEEVCETDVDLFKTDAAIEFLKEMNGMLRSVIGSQVHENVGTIAELKTIAEAALNFQIVVYFFDDQAQQTPIELLLLSRLTSSNMTISYATTSRKSEAAADISNFLMMLGTINSNEKSNQNAVDFDLVNGIKNNPRLFLFSLEFLRLAQIFKETGTISGGEESPQKRMTTTMSEFSPSELAELTINEKYVETLKKSFLVEEFVFPFHNHHDHGHCDHHDHDHDHHHHHVHDDLFSQISKFLAPYTRPPPSLNHHTPVPQCSSFRECLTNHPSVPFIIKNTLEFRDEDLNISFDTAVDLALNAPPKSNSIKGALRVTGERVRYSVPEVMKSWLNDTIEGNFLYIASDTTTEWFPRPKVVDEFDKNPEKSFRTLIFTFENAYTGLHADPGEEGGSWMHLFRGRKLWHFHHPRHHNFFADFPDAQPSQLPPDAKIGTFACLAESGDTVYFPPAWLHRVWTFEKSFGLNSYITPKGISVEEHNQNVEYRRVARDRNH